MSASSEAQDDTCNLIASLDEVRRSYSSKPSGLVVHLLGARNVPRLLQLNRTSLTPYVRLWVIDHDGREVGERASWAPRPATRQPVWNCARDLRVPPMSYAQLQRSLLHVELWDHDALLPPNHIGAVDVPLMTLLSASHLPVFVPPSALSRADGEASSRELDPGADGACGSRASTASSAVMHYLKRGIYALSSGAEGEGETPRSSPCTVLLRLVPAYPRRKRLFIVRHGESEWNRGQASMDLGAMYAQVDHPLSAEGRRQAPPRHATPPAGRP